MSQKLSDDRIKHLEMLQGVVTRMATASATIKTLCMTIIAGALAFVAANPNPKIPLFAAILTSVFWLLDAQYLRQERWFRDMYDNERSGDAALPATFIMTPSNEIRKSTELSYGLWGWSTSGLYFPLVVFLLVLWFVNS